MASEICVNIGSGNGLLLDGIKPLPEPMLTDHQLKSTYIHIRAISQDMPQPSITEIPWKITYLKFHLHFPGTNELNVLTSCWLPILLSLVLIRQGLTALIPFCTHPPHPIMTYLQVCTPWKFANISKAINHSTMNSTALYHMTPSLMWQWVVMLHHPHSLKEFKFNSFIYKQ